MNERQQELASEKFGGIAVCDDIACKKCVFALADPQSSHCKIYTPQNGLKPHDVYFFSKSCEYFKSHDDLKNS